MKNQGDQGLWSLIPSTEEWKKKMPIILGVVALVCVFMICVALVTKGVCGMFRINLDKPEDIQKWNEALESRKGKVG